MTSELILTVIGKICKSDQNKIFPEFRNQLELFNSKKYTHMILTKLQNCAKAE